MVRTIGISCALWVGCLSCLAQQLRFENIRRLPPSINTQVEEAMPLLSPDGKTLYFTRALYPGNHGGKFSGLDIWTSQWVGNKWGVAENSTSLNDSDHNVVVGLHGRRIYFTRSSGWSRTPGVYYVEKNESGWSRPQLLEIPSIENLGFLSFYVSPDLDVIFLSMKGPDSRGHEDIYFSVKQKDGSWTPPKNVGATINTAGFEISPFLSADKKRLYFASNGHGGYGDSDIFYCERMYGSWETWSAPVNLGPAINSPKFDAYFSLYGDTLALFTSNRESNYADIYQADVSSVRTILAEGQHYLDGAALARAIGEQVRRNIVFKGGARTLDAAQDELLFYIVNKLMLERDIEFHLVVREEDESDLSSDRLKAIVASLRKHGIDSARIHIDQVELPRASDKAVVEIRLFR